MQDALRRDREISIGDTLCTVYIVSFTASACLLSVSGHFHFLYLENMRTSNDLSGCLYILVCDSLVILEACLK
jgi:hypothetical protein